MAAFTPNRTEADDLYGCELFVEALEHYEALERQGNNDETLLFRLGNCLLKNRQRKDAEALWIRILQEDPAHFDARMALEKYCPGWERRFKRKKTAAASAHPASKNQDTAPPATAPKSKLTMEAITPKPAPVSPPHEASPAPAPAPAPAPEPRPVAAVAVSTPAESTKKTFGHIHWDYVFADVQAELAVANKG